MKAYGMLLIAGCVLVAAPVLQAQPLSPQEVTAAMKAPDVKDAFDACAGAAVHPDTVKLVVIIGEDGAVALNATIPAVDTHFFDCLASVTAMVKLRATGQKYKMVYSLALPPAPAPAEVSAPAEASAPPPAPVVHVTPPAPVPPAAEATVAYEVEQPPPVEPLTDVPIDVWYGEYSRGTAMFVVGMILTIGGGVLVIFPAIYGTALIMICDTEHEDCDSFNPMLLGMALGGVAALGVGVTLLALGISKRRKADLLKKGCGWQGLNLSPNLASGGAVLSSVWRF